MRMHIFLCSWYSVERT